MLFQHSTSSILNMVIYSKFDLFIALTYVLFILESIFMKLIACVAHLKHVLYRL